MQLVESVVSIQMSFHSTVNFLANCLFIFSALDPAKPWFDITDLSNTLSKSDATLVDVIHTKSGRLYNVSTMYISTFTNP